MARLAEQVDDLLVLRGQQGGPYRPYRSLSYPILRLLRGRRRAGATTLRSVQ
jgi:hypothetical protein